MSEVKVNDLRKMVESTLRDEPDTRNSDIELAIRIWVRYYPELVTVGGEGELSVKCNDLFRLPREHSVKRIRAKIQNDDGEYPPTEWDIAEKRGWLEIEWKRKMGYHVENPGQRRLGI